VRKNTDLCFCQTQRPPWVQFVLSPRKNLDRKVIRSNNEAMPPAKENIITFKVDGALAEAMRGVANRSEFIRSAVLAALDSICPLCGGSGVLTANQMRHWREFAASHIFEECRDCHENRLVCRKQKTSGAAVHKKEGDR
jgi:hypothetical protein